MDAGARTNINDIVGSPDRVFIVLHHNQGVAEVPQLEQGGEQPIVIPLVQADARFIEHVQHAREAGTDLGGQANPLGFAP